jgi:hypothetical protein
MTTKVIIKSADPNHEDLLIRIKGKTRDGVEMVTHIHTLTDGQELETYVHSNQWIEIGEVQKKR